MLSFTSGQGPDPERFAAAVPAMREDSAVKCDRTQDSSAGRDNRPVPFGPGRVFRFGDVSRLRPYCVRPEDLTPLDPINLWRLTPNDLIVTARPRSALIEGLFLLRAPQRRPAILSVSDGYIFRLNAHKSGNRRYGWLNRHVLADRLLVTQPTESLAGLCDDMEAVASIVRYDTTDRESLLRDPVLVLVAGNDPFFDLPREACVAAFADAYRTLRARFGPGIRICLSAPNAALARPVLAASPGLEEIGRIVDAGIDPADCVFVGSPSTVQHDQFLAGRPTYVLPLYGNSGVERFCAPLATLLGAEEDAEGIRFAHKAPEALERDQPMVQADLLGWCTSRRSPMFGLGRYLREFQILVLINELRILFMGYKDNRT